MWDITRCYLFFQHLYKTKLEILSNFYLAIFESEKVKTASANINVHSNTSQLALQIWHLSKVRTSWPYRWFWQTLDIVACKSESLKTWHSSQKIHGFYLHQSADTKMSKFMITNIFRSKLAAWHYRHHGKFNPIRSQLETVLDFWLVNVCMEECELIKSGHTFGLPAVNLFSPFESAGSIAQCAF